MRQRNGLLIRRRYEPRRDVSSQSRSTALQGVRHRGQQHVDRREAGPKRGTGALFPSVASKPRPWGAKSSPALRDAPSSSAPKGVCGDNGVIAIGFGQSHHPPRRGRRSHRLPWRDRRGVPQDDGTDKQERIPFEILVNEFERWRCSMARSAVEQPPSQHPPR